jgi:hypothetical protein
VETGLSGSMRELYIPGTICIGVDNYNLSQRAPGGYPGQLAVWNRVLSDIKILSLYNKEEGLKY